MTIRHFTFKVVHHDLSYTFVGIRTEPTDKEFEIGGIVGGDTYRLTHVWTYNDRYECSPEAVWRSRTGKERREIIAKVRTQMKTHITSNGD